MALFRKETEGLQKSESQKQLVQSNHSKIFHSVSVYISPSSICFSRRTAKKAQTSFKVAAKNVNQLENNLDLEERSITLKAN